jgi:hypothetical protein
MSKVTAAVSIVPVIAIPTNQGLVRRTAKPATAAINKTAAINSAIRPIPADVILVLDRRRGRVEPVPVRAH